MKANNMYIYNASAGSGKTYTLVQDYLSILLAADRYDKFKEVLAITFTNKAAKEMKSRLLDKLIEFSEKNVLNPNPENPKEINAYNELCKMANLLNKTPTFIHKKSQKVLFEILHNYGAFSISTIDKFTHRIIRSFSVNLGLPLNFEVEMDLEKMLEESIDLLLTKLDDLPELSRFLIQYQLDKLNEGSNGDIVKDILEVSKDLINDKYLEELESFKTKELKDFSVLKKELQEKTKKFSTKLAHISSQWDSLFSSLNVEANLFSRGSLPKYFENLKSKHLEESKVIPSSTLIKMANEEVSLYAKSKAASAGAIEANKSEILSLLNQAIDLVNLEYPKYLFFGQVLKNLTPMAVFSQVQKELNQIKEDNNILLISDFNKLINEEIKNQPVPYIYEKIGERYKHFFIDEFQDTSRLQWANLEPLAENALASEGTVMLVGDIKQAIYAWRGGDSDQFIEIMAKDNVPYLKNIENLGVNYRSTENIIDFNNQFFTNSSKFIQNTSTKSFYEIGNKMETNSRKNGYVEIREFPKIDKQKEGLKFKQASIAQTVEEIESLLKTHSPKDIAVLTRSNAEAQMAVEALLEVDIPVISKEALLINNAKEVQLVTAFLKSMLPFNAALYRFEAVNLMLELELININPEDRHSFIQEVITEDWLVKLAENDINIDWEYLQKKGLYELVEAVFRAFDILDSAKVYGQFFLDFVFDYTRMKNQNLHEFILFWDDKKEKASIVSSEGQDAVEVLTVHKSKGLQYNIVFIPFMNWDFFKSSNFKMWSELEDNTAGFDRFYTKNKKIKEHSIYQKLSEDVNQEFQELYSKEIDQSLNVLYVAMTRAVKQMYIYTEGPGQKGFAKESMLALFADFLADKNREENTYTFGEKEKIKTKEYVAKVFDEKDKKVVSLPYHHRIKIAPTTPNSWTAGESTAIQDGNILHLAMSKINTDKDLSFALAYLENEGLVSQDKKEFLGLRMQELMNHPDLKAFFSQEYKVYNERDFLGVNGEVIRPDRLVIKDKTASIIDYKTGGRDPKYQKQIREYGWNLKQSGFEIDKLYLVYLKEGIEIESVNL